MTALIENLDPTTIPTQSPAPAVLLELTADQVAQHPDNLRDPGRSIKELTASVSEVGVLVPLSVVPVGAVPQHDFAPGVAHVAVMIYDADPEDQSGEGVEVRVTYGARTRNGTGTSAGTANSPDLTPHAAMLTPSRTVRTSRPGRNEKPCSTTET